MSEDVSLGEGLGDRWLNPCPDLMPGLYYPVAAHEYMKRNHALKTRHTDSQGVKGNALLVILGQNRLNNLSLLKGAAIEPADLSAFS